MSNALRKFDKPAEAPTQVKAVMRTRCGCEQVVDIPLPPPSTVTVELEPMPRPAPALPEATTESETRVFYLRAQGTLKGTKEAIYLYMEGPNPEKRIIVPGRLV